VLLSSIKAPRLPRRVAPAGAPRAPRGAEELDAGEPWAAEAKDFLRGRLIGARPRAPRDAALRAAHAPGAGRPAPRHPALHRACCRCGCAR